MDFDASTLLAGLLMSSIGFVLLNYGRKMSRPPHLIAGIVLLVYPYFVPGALLVLGIGAAILGLLLVLGAARLVAAGASIAILSVVKLLRTSLGVLVALFPLWSCGGSTVSDLNGTGASGSGAAGSGSGASGGAAGSGAGGVGAAAGTSSGGGGGDLPELCTLPQASGMCDAAFAAYWHNPETGVCEPFTYGGCGGNDNRFDTLAECQASCNGGTPNYDACRVPTDCVLTSLGCCGSCEPVNAGAFVAVNRSKLDPYHADCGQVSCGACPGVPLEFVTSQYFVATCQRKQCVVVDIRETEVTECEQPSDCVLRVGANCCEGCGGDGVVAINPDADLSGLVCGDEPVGCDACAPAIDPGYDATCIEGRCVVGFPACTLEDPCPL